VDYRQGTITYYLADGDMVQPKPARGSDPAGERSRLTLMSSLSSRIS